MSHFETLVKLAKEAAKEKEFERAEMLYKKALEDTPDSTNCLYSLGKMYFEAKRYEEAELLFWQCFKCLMLNTPKDCYLPDAMCHLTKLFIETRQWGKIAAFYKMPLPGDEDCSSPPGVLGANRLGMILVQKPEISLRFHYIRVSLYLENNFRRCAGWALASIADIHREMGRYEEAKRVLLQATETDLLDTQYYATKLAVITQK